MLQYRDLTPGDQDKLWHWLHVSLWDPPPSAPRPLGVLQLDRVRIYAEGWGRASDVGVVAVVDGVDAGACWMRLLPQDVGLAFIDVATPQLGVALDAPYRHRGVGRPLMREALAAAKRTGHSRVSLTVHPENPARHLYQSLGFQEVERRSGYVLMLANLT